MNKVELLEKLGEHIPTFGSWDDASVNPYNNEVEYHTDILSVLDYIGGFDCLGDNDVHNSIRFAMVALVEDVAAQYARRVDPDGYKLERVYKAMLSSPRRSEYGDALVETMIRADDRYYDVYLGFRVNMDRERGKWVVSPYIYFGFDYKDTELPAFDIPGLANEDTVDRIVSEVDPYKIIYQ